MQTVSVIILTLNERLHIKRCIERIRPLSDEIYVVDCGSTDNTVEIAQSLGATVVNHAWEGNHALQFNWALDNLPLRSQWVLRLDADEYLLPETIDEVVDKLSNAADETSGLIMPLRSTFLGQTLKHRAVRVELLRLFRRGTGRCELRNMDEHIVLSAGKSVLLKGAFVDDNLNDVGWWTQKHISYAVREAADLLDIEYGLTDRKEVGQLSEQAASKRRRKEKYARSPLFLRSFAYFCYRYIFLLGFLDGRAGFMWNFLQGWWYRTLVDVKIWEIKRESGGNKETIKQILTDKYGIKL